MQVINLFRIRIFLVIVTQKNKITFRASRNKCKFR